MVEFTIATSSLETQRKNPFGKLVNQVAFKDLYASIQLRKEETQAKRRKLEMIKKYQKDKEFYINQLETKHQEDRDLLEQAYKLMKDFKDLEKRNACLTDTLQLNGFSPKPQ